MKIHTIGGYEKVGGNMTAVEVNDQIVIFDIGADIEKAKKIDKNWGAVSRKEAITKKAVPDDSKIREKSHEVVAIVVGHGHQDHCLGIPKLADAYGCPIIATPYTISVIQRIIDNDVEDVDNEMIELEPGDGYHISKNLELEFVPITHSIPQTVLPVLKTEEGTVVYSLDFKIDEEPTLGEPFDGKRLRKLREEGVRALIMDCTRADEPGKADSESSVRNELKGLLDSAYDNDRGTIVTTFSSHIARIRNIIRANRDRRKIAVLGRSLKEYMEDAEEHGLIDLSDVNITSDHFEMERILSQASKDKSEYLLIVTGSQGEPNAILPRISKDEYPYDFGSDEIVVFSSSIIPTSTDIFNNSLLKRRLRRKGVEIESDVHSHGHAKREDHLELFRLLKPDSILPAHGGREKQSSCAELAKKEEIDSVEVSKNKETVSLDNK